MSSNKVAVVTGSNKGIGFEIVKGLCKKFQGVVYLTARDVSRGQQAVEKLKQQGLNPKFHQLDITHQDSVDKFKDYVKETHGGLDLLINNAGSAFEDPNKSFGLQADETMQLNYFATLRLCDALFPLLRQNARVINMSSSLGLLKKIPSAKLRAKFADPDLTIEDINQLMKKYVEDAKAGKAEEEGWGDASYNVSKVGVSALSIVQQKILDKETPNRNIAVNHIHPGYVKTDLTENKGELTVEEGAKSTLFTALEGNFKGKFVWKDGQIVDWFGEETPSEY